MKKQIISEEFKRMQMLAGINESQINEDKSFFTNFKEFVDKRMQEGDQDIDVSNANSFDELKQIIDDYWGWEDEQTKDMLEAFVRSYFDKDQIIYMYENFIRQNIEA